MPLKLKGSSSGDVTLDVPAAAGTNTLTLPARTGNIITSADSGTVTGTMLASATVTQSNLASNVAGNGPAFGAFSSANQTGLTSSAFVKINLNTIEFNNNSNFDATTNYRFTATVAGLYQFNCSVFATPTTANSLTQLQTFIYKNGSAFKLGTWLNALGASSYPISGYIAPVSAIVSLNATDYVEFYAYAVTSSGTWVINGDSRYTWANGALIRSA